MKQSLKRILSAAMAFIILCTLLPVSVLAAEPTSGKCGDNVYWEFDQATGTLTISGTGAMRDYANDSLIPWYDFQSDVRSVRILLGVTSIGSSAFWNCSSLSEITIPASVTSIGDWVFDGCSSLSEITIPASVTSIGSWAFAYCSSLPEITIPDSVTSIGCDVFGHCYSLRKITIPDSVTSISSGAFWNCYSLPKITIPYGVTSIGDAAFEGCSSLSEITIPASVTSIGNWAFSGCSSLDKVYYSGTETQWNKITIGYCNDGLIGLKPHAAPDDCGDDHAWDAGTVQKEASCEQSGTKLFTCTVCGETKSEIIPATGHTEVIKPAVEATCTKFGTTESRHCSVCKKVIKVQETVKALGHSYKNGKCSRCGESMNNPFKDVKSSDYFYDSVLWAVSNGITGGTSATTFSPNDPCTRGQVVTFLWAANGRPEPSSSRNPFRDVKKSDYYYKAVLWAVENGITSGFTDGTFRPNDPCTRAQVVTFLYAAEGKPYVSVTASSFNDVSNSAWYCEEVQWAVDNEITGGIGNSCFGPDQTCTRGQIATFLYKALN